MHSPTILGDISFWGSGSGVVWALRFTGLKGGDALGSWCGGSGGGDVLSVAIGGNGGAEKMTTRNKQFDTQLENVTVWVNKMKGIIHHA